MNSARDAYRELIRSHYSHCWGSHGDDLKFDRGPIHELPPEFGLLRIPPNGTRRMWTYATLCMSQEQDLHPVELHLFAPTSNDGLLELLVAVAHYHRTATALGLGDSVNFGRPWWEGSLCDHGLISLPYLDGPSLEWLDLRPEKRVRFLWLIPVTASEIDFKKKAGLEALESKFENEKVDYLRPDRKSLV